MMNNKHFINKYKKGFTIAEFTIAGLVLIIVMGILYASMTQYQLWSKKDIEKTKNVQEIRAVYDIMNYDISQAGFNAMILGQPAFKKIAETEVIFQADLYPEYPASGDSRFYGDYETIRYYLDGTILRKVVYRQTDTDYEEYKNLEMTDNIEDLKFTFFSYESGQIKEITGIPMTEADNIDLMLKYMTCHIVGKNHDIDINAEVELTKGITPKNLATMNPSNLSCRPANVSNVSISQSDCFGLEFNWRWPTGGDCPISGLRIKYLDHNNEAQTIDISRNGRTGYDAYSISAGFITGYNYEFKFATYAYGGRECKNAAIITKNASLTNPPLASPSNISAELLPNGDILVKWDPSPDVGDPDFASYRISYAENIVDGISKSATQYTLPSTEMGYCINITIELQSVDVCDGLSSPISTVLNTNEYPLPTLSGFNASYDEVLGGYTLNWNQPPMYYMINGVKIEFKGSGEPNYQELPPPYPAYNDGSITEAFIDEAYVSDLGVCGSIDFRITPYSRCNDNEEGDPTYASVIVDDETDLDVPEPLNPVLISGTNYCNLYFPSGFFSNHSNLTAFTLGVKSTFDPAFESYNEEIIVHDPYFGPTTTPFRINVDDLGGSNYITLELEPGRVYYFAVKTHEDCYTSADFAQTTDAVFLDGCFMDAGDQVIKAAGPNYGTNTISMTLKSDNSTNIVPEPDGILAHKIYALMETSSDQELDEDFSIYDNSIACKNLTFIKQTTDVDGSTIKVYGPVKYKGTATTSNINFKDDFTKDTNLKLPLENFSQSEFSDYFLYKITELQDQGHQVYIHSGHAGELVSDIYNTLNSQGYNFNQPIFVFLNEQDRSDPVGTRFIANLQKLKYRRGNGAFNITVAVNGPASIIYNNTFCKAKHPAVYNNATGSSNIWDDDQNIAIITQGPYTYLNFAMDKDNSNYGRFGGAIISTETMAFLPYFHDTYQVSSSWFKAPEYLNAWSTQSRVGSSYSRKPFTCFDLYGSLIASQDIRPSSKDDLGTIHPYSDIYERNITSRLIGLPGVFESLPVPQPNITSMRLASDYFYSNTLDPSKEAFAPLTEPFCIKDNQTTELILYFDKTIIEDDISRFYIQVLDENDNDLGTIFIK